MKLEVFFDYSCPYCMQSHEYLKTLTPQFPDIEITWNPCEAHPRPDRYGPHSDLCIRGMFFARDAGADLWSYHEIMYTAALRERIDIEDINVLAQRVAGLLDAQAFANALSGGRYIEELAVSNRYAFGRSSVWAVPAYRMNGRKLDAVENIGVSRQQLEKFLQNA